METDGTSVTIGNDNLIVTVSHAHFNYAVIFADCNGIDTILARTGILFEQCFLNDAILCAEQYIMTVNEILVVQVLHAQVCIYGVIRVYIQQVLNGASLRIFGSFGYLIYFQPIALTLLSEEHHGIVHCCRIYMFYKVLIACLCSLRTYPTAVLGTEFA